MTLWTFVLRSLFHHWRINLAVSLGAAAATAVLTGALLVGDSVRGSLRRLTLDRLGKIDEVLVTDRFFRTELAEELAESEELDEHFSAVVPAILFPNGTADRVDKAGGYASQILVVGSNAGFWELNSSDDRPAKIPSGDEVILNQALADELQVEIGDEVILRLPKSHQVPADSPLGRKTDLIRSLAGLVVVDIIPDDGLGRFSLRASQVTSRNAYVSIDRLQDVLDQTGRANAILVAGTSEAAPPDPAAEQLLADSLHPTLSDYGLSLRRVRRVFQPSDDAEEEVIYDYFSLTSDRMMIEPAIENAAEKAFANETAQRVLTYLANSIGRAENVDEISDIPYSLVSAVDSIAALGPLLDESGEPIGPLADNEIVLNSWAADNIDVQPGDEIKITYFEPETTHGDLVESSADFTLKAVVRLVEPVTQYRRNRPPPRFDRRPSLVNDPLLTPEVKGITDQDSMNDWDAPFPVDYSRLRSEDDDYWKSHRTTPKAFVSLAVGRQLWGSRFGATTSIRVPVVTDIPPGSDAETDRLADLEKSLAEELATDRAKLGFEFVPIKRNGLMAASGTTPFDVLFLFLSFFVIAAALMLVALLFRLDVEGRASEIGVLQAVGFSLGRTRRLLIAEGGFVSVIGGAVGVAAGVAYAWLMLAGLRTWWVGAITTPFLRLFITPRSLAIGYGCGVFVSAMTVSWTLWRIRKIAIRRLLAGRAAEENELFRRARGAWAVISLVLILAAVGAAAAAANLGGEAQAGAFVSAGSMILLALLILIRGWLRSGGGSKTTSGVSVIGLAIRNAARNPGRSTLTIGLMSAASFLIVAMSSFRLDPSRQGAGGFSLMAESSQPIFANLNTSEGRDELLADRAAEMKGGTILSLRVQPGDDASCNNLYQASQPRVLGIPDQMIQYFDQENVEPFAWASSAATTESEVANPWRVLNADAANVEDEVVPVVIDKNTAMYSLHLYMGIGEEFDIRYTDGTKIRFRVAGLLSNSILQGSLLISESHFVRRFPGVSGYRYFLIEPPPVSPEELDEAAERRADEELAPLPPEQLADLVAAEKRSQVTSLLEDRLSDQGFDVGSTVDRLTDLMAVQNTYLSTFQSLGALGLLLGTFGLATVQMRNVLERRGELALMRATGFRRARLAGMVLLENVTLLVTGLATGFVAALVSVLPHMLVGGASIPLVDLTIMLAIVLFAGVLSGLLSVRSTLRAPLLPALRGD